MAYITLPQQAINSIIYHKQDARLDFFIKINVWEIKNENEKHREREKEN